MTTKKQSTKKDRTKGKAESSSKKEQISIQYRPWEVDAQQFETYRSDGVFFAAILADPACPEGFRRLFAATFSDDMLGRDAAELGNPYLLPLTYAIIRDVMDASNLCGTAEGIHDTLIKAVETLVPAEIADRAREALRQGR